MFNEIVVFVDLLMNKIGGQLRGPRVARELLVFDSRSIYYATLTKGELLGSTTVTYV